MARSYQRITNQYEGLPPDTKEYLSFIPLIIDISNNVSRNKDKDIFDILLAYLFIRVEHGQRRILYGFAINEHNVKSSEAKAIINEWDIGQVDFTILYRILTKKSIKPEILEYKKKATKVRDNIIHGKIVKDGKKAEAIKNILDYIDKLNDLVRRKYKFKPFGDMTGFSRSSKPDSKTKSRGKLSKFRKKLKSIKKQYQNNPQPPAPANHQAQEPPNAQ